MIKTISYDTDNLGCVMLNVEPMTEVDDVIPASLWFSNDTVKGRETEPHITLLYGLLTPAYLQEAAIMKALENWDAPAYVEFRGFGFFHGNDYDVLFARVHEYSSTLVDKAHGMLSTLPHVNTFYPYCPHLTLGYVPPGAGPLLSRALNGALSGGLYRLDTRGINLGRDLRLDKKDES